MSEKMRERVAECVRRIDLARSVHEDDRKQRKAGSIQQFGAHRPTSGPLGPWLKEQGFSWDDVEGHKHEAPSESRERQPGEDESGGEDAAMEELRTFSFGAEDQVDGQLPKEAWEE